MPNEENEILKEEVVDEEAEVKEKKSAKKKIEKLEEELNKLKADVEHWKNEYYRAYADTKNLRASLEKDHHNAIKYRAEGFIENLLPVLDSFHMALGNEPTSPELKNYLVGFQFIYRNLVSVLESEGVTEIAPEINTKFDANTMNAVDTETVEGEANLITKVHSKGYKLHDRLIRPASVTVTINEVKTEEPKEENQNLDA